MTIEKLIRELHEYAAELPGATVYVRQETYLNGASWVSPSNIRTGLDPHPLSGANDGTLVVFVS